MSAMNYLSRLKDKARRAALFAGAFVPLAPTPDSSKFGQLYGTSSLATFLNGLFVAAISIGAILAVLRLAYAGYEYMTSDAWGSKSHAKEIIAETVLGLLLLLGTWLTLNQINPKLLDLNILRNVSSAQQQNSFITDRPTNA